MVTTLRLAAILALLFGRVDVPPLIQTAEPSSESAKRDLDGDPLPPGAIARLGTKVLRTERVPAAISFISDGKLLTVTTQSGHLQHWDPATGKLLRQRQLSEHAVNAASAPPGQRNVAVHGSYTDPIREEQIAWLAVFSQLTGQEIMRIETDDWRAEKIVLSPDGRTVAFGRDRLHIVDVESKKETGSRPVEGREIHSLCFSPDSATLALGAEGKLTLWNFRGDAAPRTIAVGGNPQYSPPRVECLAFSPDGKTLAAQSGREHDAPIVLLDAATGQTIRAFKADEVRSWYLRSIAFSPDGKYLAANIDDMNAGGGIALWETDTGKFVRRLSGMYGNAYWFAFSPDARRLAAASNWDHTLCVWDLETGQVVGGDKPGHLASPGTLRFFDGDRQLATAGDDGTVRIWNLADQQQVRLLHLVRRKNRNETWIRGMDVSPDGKYVAAAAFDDTTRVWELASGREVYQLVGHGTTGGYRTVKFTPDSKKIVSWGDNMYVYLWDVGTGKALQEYRLRPAGIELPPEDESSDALERGLSIGSGYFSHGGNTLSIEMSPLRRFDVATGQELPALKAGGDQISTVVVSPDEQFVLVAKNGDYEHIRLKDGSERSVPPKEHTLALHRFSNGEIVTKSEAPGSCGPVVFSPKGGRLAAIRYFTDAQWQTGTYTVEVRRVPDLTELGVIELTSHPRALEFSSTGNLLAVALGDTTVVIWDVEHLPHPNDN